MRCPEDIVEVAIPGNDSIDCAYCETFSYGAGCKHKKTCDVYKVLKEAKI